MAFEDVAKTHATFVSGHAVGESIEYRVWPGTTWQTFNAKVDRQPVGEVGQFLRNTVSVYVSKEALAGVVITKDELRLTKDKRPTEQAPSYTVMSVRESPGHWLLDCERKK